MMSDWEVFADTEAHMLAVAKATGFWHAAQMAGSVVRSPEGVQAQGTLKSGTQYFFNYYKIKWVQQGTQLNPWGQPEPKMVPAAGVWATLRWLPLNGTDVPPAIDPATGVTLNPLPANAFNMLAS